MPPAATCWFLAGEYHAAGVKRSVTARADIHHPAVAGEKSFLGRLLSSSPFIS